MNIDELLIIAEKQYKLIPDIEDMIRKVVMKTNDTETVKKLTDIRDGMRVSVTCIYLIQTLKEQLTRTTIELEFYKSINEVYKTDIEEKLIFLRSYLNKDVTDEQMFSKVSEWMDVKIGKTQKDKLSQILNNIQEQII